MILQWNEAGSWVYPHVGEDPDDVNCLSAPTDGAIHHASLFLVVEGNICVWTLTLICVILTVDGPGPTTYFFGKKATGLTPVGTYVFGSVETQVT